MKITAPALICKGGALVDSDMYLVDITPTAGQTYAVASAAILTNGADSVDLYCKTVGANASSAGVVTFTVTGSRDGTNFETVGTPIAMTLTTNVAALLIAKMDTRNFVALQILKVVNGDASYALGATNIHCYALQ